MIKITRRKMLGVAGSTWYEFPEGFSIRHGAIEYAWWPKPQWTREQVEEAYELFLIGVEASIG